MAAASEETPSWMVDGAAPEAPKVVSPADSGDGEHETPAAVPNTEYTPTPPPAETGPLNPAGIKILIVCVGSRGDVAPAAALGASCMCQGAKSVAVATHPIFKELMPAELGFYNLGPSLDEALLSSPEGKAVIEASSFTKSAAMRRFMGPYVDNLIDQIASAVSTFVPDTIVWFTNAVFVASPIQDRFPTLASVWCHLLPFHQTSEHAPPVGFGDGQTYFSFGANLKWSYAMSGRYELYKASVDAKRAGWGLPPSQMSLYETPERTLNIMGYNSSICPRPSDWDTDNVHVVGSLLQRTIEVSEEENRIRYRLYEMG
jgi:hypothetical protein